MTDNMINSSLPESIVMGPDTTYSPLFWDEEGVAIGDYDLLYIRDEEYSTSSIVGLKEWFMQADKYDPYTDIAEFTTEGQEEWINQGYEFAKQLRAIISKDILLYYGYWHQFGDGQWRWCKAFIPMLRNRRRDTSSPFPSSKMLWCESVASFCFGL